MTEWAGSFDNCAEESRQASRFIIVLICSVLKLGKSEIIRWILDSDSKNKMRDSEHMKPD